MKNSFGSYPGEKVGRIYFGPDQKTYPLKRVKMPGDKASPRNNYILETGKTDVPFFSVHLIDKKHKIAGVYVPPNIRGNGLGRTLIGIAFELAERTKNVIDATCTMRKPSIAILMEKYGFKPKNTGVQVKIIGEEKYRGDKLPVVYIPAGTQKIDEIEGEQRFLIVSNDPKDAKRTGRTIVLSVPYILSPHDEEGQKLFCETLMGARSNFLISDLERNFKL